MLQVALAGELDQRRLWWGFQAQFFADRSPGAQTEAKLMPTASLDPRLWSKNASKDTAVGSACAKSVWITRLSDGSVQIS